MSLFIASQDQTFPEFDFDFNSFNVDNVSFPDDMNFTTADLTVNNLNNSTGSLTDPVRYDLPIGGDGVNGVVSGDELLNTTPPSLPFSNASTVDTSTTGDVSSADTLSFPGASTHAPSSATSTAAASVSTPLSNNPDTSLHIPALGMGPSTWATRNPLKDVQSSRARPYQKLSDAEKISREKKATASRKKMLALSTDIRAFKEDQVLRIEQLAKKHDKKSDYIEGLVLNETVYKDNRSVNLWNAKIHAKTVEVNSDRDEGKKYSFTEIKGLVMADPKLMHPSREREQELRDQLTEHRNLVQTGARASNHSAAIDARKTLLKLGVELQNVSERAGIYAFAFSTRGHTQDTAMPGYVKSREATQFFREVLDIDPFDLAVKFEQWAVSKGENNEDCNTLSAIRSQCATLILNGLKFLTKSKNVTMNYVNYDRAIMEKYKVQLRGWPVNIVFQNPSDIGLIDKLRALREALRTGTCMWVRMSKAEENEHAAMLKRTQDAGGVVGKPRKTRSDKGTKRKRTDAGEEVEGEQDTRKKNKKCGKEKAPKKRGTRAKKTATPRASTSKQLPPAAKSREFLDSDDDRSDEDDA